VQLYGALKIDRNDADARVQQYKENFKFFDAPVGLFVSIDRRLGPGQFSDLGSYITTLMLLARAHGLDTCPQESWARAYRTVGAFLKLPPEQMLFCGLAIGYRDAAHAANSFRSPRAPLEEFCTFIGFDEA
jgi:nitroreductase